MTSDSGRLPQGGDAKQAPCEASQSGGVAASPEHRSSPSIDEELIERLRAQTTFTTQEQMLLIRWAADRLEALRSERAKLEERVRDAKSTIRYALEAIESHRSEPLFIARDSLRNWLDDIVLQLDENPLNSSTDRG